MQLDTTYSKKTVEKLLDGESEETVLETNIVYEDVFLKAKSA